MNIAVKISNHMMIFMGNGTRRADVAATETGDTIFKLGDHRFLVLLVEAEAFRGTDVKAESASATGLFFYCHFKHLYLLSLRMV
jgi:hypothetical protein